MSENRIPDKTLLNAITERIVATVQPRRIVLFGSAAEGRMGPDSDIDLLIIMPDGVHRRNTARVIYRKLSGMGFSKDIIVVTENDILKNRDNPSLVIHPALKHGKELYHATWWQAGSAIDWLARAKGDLALAGGELPDGAFLEDLCFHAQQAAEKALKAVHVHHSIKFRYTQPGRTRHQLET